MLITSSFTFFFQGTILDDAEKVPIYLDKAALPGTTWERRGITWIIDWCFVGIAHGFSNTARCFKAILGDGSIKVIKIETI